MTPKEETAQKLSDWRDRILADPHYLDDVLTEEIETAASLVASPFAVLMLSSLVGIQEACRTFFEFGVAYQKQVSDSASPLSDLLKDVNI